MYMSTGDTVQIEAPKFDPDIDGDNPLGINEKPNQITIQGMLPTTPEVTEPEDDNSPTPGTNIHNNQLPKKPIGLTLSLCKFQESFHRQLNQKNKDTTDVKPNTTLKILKSLN